jgi:hypothetical protein
LMTLASKHLAVSQPEHARATTPRGACIAAGGLDAETFRGFQLAGELFLLISFFIEPEGRREFRSAKHLRRETGFELTTLRLTHLPIDGGFSAFGLSVFRRGSIRAPNGCPVLDRRYDVTPRHSENNLQISLSPEKSPSIGIMIGPRRS